MHFTKQVQNRAHAKILGPIDSNSVLRPFHTLEIMEIRGQSINLLELKHTERDLHWFQMLVQQRT